MTVGTIVKLTVTCLGNDSGTLGVGFNDYGSGCQFIFENGSYDGFSIDEQENFLEEVGRDNSLVNYQFQNVMILTEDFRNGVFSNIINALKN